MDNIVCKKTAYSNEKFAEDHIMRIAKTSVRSRIPVRSYYCGKCGFWHITSQNSKKDEKINELEEEIKKLKNEIKSLQDKNKRELDKEVNADIRIKKMNDTIQEKQKIISKQRLDISNLVSQINSQSQIEKFNNRYSKQD